MGENEPKQACLELMETVDVAYLSTIDSNGFPHTRIMSNLRDKKQHPNLAGFFEKHQEDFLIYMVTSSSSAKMQHIRNNPKVSVYFASYTEVPTDFQCLMLAGEIEEISDQQLKKQLWQSGWEIFWQKGVDDPEYTVLRLMPTFARGGYKEKLFEFELNGQR
ncbi:MAG: pyridoxamine 5'-phosphate oxidase family protein [Phycisphaerales bacterium]|nr:MAG: pyridoxamine 5'-phosphate oxidase family protein [Phycisphaerales bacterium]